MTDRTLQLYNSNRVYYSLERDIAGSAELSSSDMTNEIGVEDNSKDLTTTSDDVNQSSPPRIDNPDQRITEDVRTFTAFSLNCSSQLLPPLLT